MLCGSRGQDNRSSASQRGAVRRHRQLAVVGECEGCAGRSGEEAGVRGEPEGVLLAGFLRELSGGCVRERGAGPGGLKNPGGAMAERRPFGIPLSRGPLGEGVEGCRGRLRDRKVSNGVPGQVERAGDAGDAVAPGVGPAGNRRGLSSVKLVACDAGRPAPCSRDAPPQQPLGCVEDRRFLAAGDVPGGISSSEKSQGAGDYLVCQAVDAGRGRVFRVGM